MPWRLRDLSIATTVLSVVVTVTVAVSMLGVNMYNTVDGTASVAEDLAYGMARDIVSERGKFLALSFETRVFRPVRENVELGKTSALILGNTPMGWGETALVTRSMLARLQASTRVFPREGWVVNVVNGVTELTVKGYLDDNNKREMIRFANGSTIWYRDRYPVPLDSDKFLQEDGGARAFGDDFIREDKAIAYVWGEVNGDDPSGQLEMGYGGPILPGTVDTNIFIFCEISLDLLRPLLQSIIGGGEPLMVGQYNNTAYTPTLNETILCILEIPTGTLLECTHGFASINTGSVSAPVWHRVVGIESEHPIIGPGIRVATGVETQTGTRDRVFRTSGTARFPLQGQIRYFIDIEPLKNGPLWSRVVITPYDALLREVEEHTDKERDNALNTIITVVFIALGVTVVAIMAASLIAVKISDPITKLVHDMHRVEVMDINGIETSKEGSVSIVREVEEMKKSFLAMVAMLVEYKSFIPSHLIAEESAEATTEESMSQKKSFSTKMTKSVDHIKNLFALDLTTKHCSVGSVMLKSSVSNSDLAAAYNEVLEGVLRSSTGTGVHVNLTFDSVVMCFNATTRLMSYTEKGLRAMAMFTQLDLSLVVGCSYEVATAAVGNVGTQASRFYAVCPDVIVRSRVVPGFAASRGQNHVYCSTRVVETCKNFRFLTLDLLVVPSCNPVKVSRLTEEKKVDSEEWMYSLDEEERLPHAVFNAAFQEMVDGKFKSAAVGFEKCEPQFTKECRDFLDLMKEHRESEGNSCWYMQHKASSFYASMLSSAK
eukprot:TRINITY_DN7170_c0_g1_i3.p1 TRINITY_DN7170_c0_g1~~TRINITY_DN7170_c0_g1_i3.p1  ORF type:complete len:774 (+),score=111.25 TRINITY_DN7170_c0_g1_i3:100-2421(+)